MNPNCSLIPKRQCPNLFGVAAALLVALTLPALAAEPAGESAQQRYQRERADCLAGRSVQSVPVCLQEAGAALAEARRSGLSSPAGEALRNQHKRCEPLPPADRQDCMARMSGAGKTQGSVAEGGIYRELTTRSTGVAPASASPASSVAPAASAAPR